MTKFNNDDSNKNTLSLEEENLLKDAMLFLQDEYNIKKDKLKILRQELSLTKKQFQAQLQEYQKEIKLTIEKEKDIQQLYSKISKMKKRRALIIKNSFNKKFYLHLLEISSNNKKEKILQNYFSLLILENNQETRSVKELLQILRNEDEIKNLLYYSYKIYCDLRTKDEKLYNDLREKYENYFSELKELDGEEYPFDEMFECLGIIFDIIEYEKDIKESNFILNKLTEKKNAKFVEIKSIEHRIKNYYKNIKKIQSHIKIIHSFYDNFKEQNAFNDRNSLKELIDNIEEYKKKDFDYNKMSQNFDAITSLTFGTYCTQSEDSSMKSSTLGSKNKLLNNKLLKSNNININNKESKVSQFNTYEHKDDLNKNLKNNKSMKKLNKNLKEIKNDKINSNNNKNKNNMINDNSKELKNKDNKDNKDNNTNKSDNNKLDETKNNKLNNKQIKNFKNKELNKNQQNINEKKNNNKNDTLILKQNNNNNINQIKEKKSNNDKENINEKENKIEEEIIDNKKNGTNFANLHLLGSKINQLKYREPDESVEMTMPKENLNKNYNIINTEYNINDSSVCDEMVSFNYEKGNNIGRSTNDYINKIGVKNNVVFSQEIYKNRLINRRNNNDFGKLKIEKSIESSTCCVSCT